MLRKARGTFCVRVIAGTLVAALAWLAGPAQAASAVANRQQQLARQCEGRARVLTLRELENIRGSATWPGAPRPWQHEVTVLGGYGHLNPLSGNLHVAIPVLSIPGKGAGLSLAFYHNSAGQNLIFSPTAQPPISPGWSHTYHVYLQGAGTTSVTVVEADGSTNTFSQNMNGSFNAPAGVWDTLVRNGNGTYTLTRKSGLQLNFGSNNKLATLVDRNGNTTTVAYNGAGHVSTVTDASSRQLTFSYNGSNQLTSVSDPASRSFTLTYSSQWLQKITFPAPTMGAAQPYFQFGYQSFRATLASFRNRRGSTWTLSASGGPSSDFQSPGTITDPTSHTVVYNSSVTMENGIGYTWTTDGSGNLTGLTQGTTMTYPGANIVHSYTRDGSRNLVTRTTPGGHDWDYTYDSRGNVLTVEDPLTGANGMVTLETYTYNGLDLPTSKIDALGHETDYTYDAYGNLTSVVDPLLETTTHTYDGAGQRLTTTDARSKVWSYTYDTYGNQTESEDPLGNTTVRTFDTLGQRTSEISPAGVEEDFTYDNLARLKRVTHEDSNYVEITYDEEGAVLTVRDENGNVITNTYNSLGWPTAVTDELSHTTSFTYSPTGTRTSLTNARSKTTTFTLDNAGRVVDTDYPDGTSEQVTYNADGAIATRVDGRGYTRSYTYDDAGRMTDITYPTGTNTTFDYLDNGLRSEMTDRTGTTQWTYSARDEMTQVDRPQGTINYTYAATGQIASLGRSGAGTTYYYLDDAGRLSSLTNGFSETTSFTRNASGQITEQDNANGTKSLCTYSGTRGWLTAMEHRQSNNTVLAGYSYTRDDSGRITAETQSGDHTTSYTYDDVYQLTDETRTGSSAYSISYTYDSVGDRLTKVQSGVTESYTYGNNNQLLTAGSKSYGYDNNGNLTSVTVGSNVTTLTWDYNDKLTGITYPNSSTNSFVTDDQGHRTSLTDSGGTTAYLFDGDRVIADSRADYTNGGISGTISERSGSTTKVYHGDQLGSTRGLTNSSQTVTDTREYDAWGLSIAASGSGTPFGFVGGQGYQKDTDSGLMLLGARYYDPSVGRFISRDPLGYGGGDVCLYGYCRNQPVESADPSGLLSWIGVAGGVLGVVGAVIIVGTASPFLLTAIVIGAAVGAGLTVLTATHDPGQAVLEAAEAGALAYTAYVAITAAMWAGTMMLTNCFPAGTPVVTYEGQKPIETIRPGDFVLSADTDTGEQSYQQVVRTFVKTADELYTVETDDGERIEATGEHPFWVIGRGFVPAKRLAPGDELRQANGEQPSVVSVGWRHGKFRVYNFEVANTHTYYAGKHNLWVHNDCWADARKLQEEMGGEVKMITHFDATGEQRWLENGWWEHAFHLKDNMVTDSMFLGHSNSISYEDYAAKWSWWDLYTISPGRK